MDTLDVKQHLKKIHPSLENNVYAANRLPMYTHVATYILCNLDTDDKPGSHWIALYIDTNGIGQYFDSYGRSSARHHLEFLKRNCKRWDWNVDRIQNEWTSVCETTWDPPDNYLSITQQEEKKLKEEQSEKKQKKLKKQKQKEVFKEVEALVNREKMKELAVKKPDATTSGTQFGPAQRPDKPYGSWTPVVNEPVENVDLQLPKCDKELPPPPVVVEPEVIQFKEKRVESLGDGPVVFKKRKFNNPKRNIRQKLDDE